MLPDEDALILDMYFIPEANYKRCHVVSPIQAKRQWTNLLSSERPNCTAFYVVPYTM